MGSAKVIVTLLFRRPVADEHFSIERLFGSLQDGFQTQGIEQRPLRCPWFSTGLLNRLKSLAWAFFCRGHGLVHITGDLNFLALVIPKRRLVITFHDLRSLQRLSGWRRALFRALWVRWPAQRAARIACVSPQTLAELLAEVPGLDLSKLRVIPNCLTEPVDPAPRAFPTGRLRALLVGTRPHKNVARILEALAPLGLDIAVIGPLSAEDQQRAKALGVSLVNLVAASDDEVRKQYRLSDLVVFVPTYEGFGLPILEAQAMGRPLVTSRREPMQGVAGEGACLAHPDSAEDIRQQVMRLIEDPAYRESVVQAGARNLERFSAGTAAAAYAALYREAWAEARP